jgi:hypothetical protein
MKVLVLAFLIVVLHYANIVLHGTILKIILGNYLGIAILWVLLHYGYCYTMGITILCGLLHYGYCYLLRSLINIYFQLWVLLSSSVYYLADTWSFPSPLPLNSSYFRWKSMLMRPSKAYLSTLLTNAPPALAPAECLNTTLELCTPNTW